MHALNEMNLSREQELAVEIMLSGVNVFLTGKAGTGKSVVVREFLRRYRGNLAVLAPTGIAALNIEGCTIHSLFGPDLTSSDPGMSVRTFNLLSRIDAILIDEISLVRADFFDRINILMKMVASPRNEHLSFGGKQVIVVGDFCQLPPIIASRTEQVFIENVYGSPFAFASDAWRKGGFEIINLRECFRLSDARLMKIANAIRSGCADRDSFSEDQNDCSLLDYLNDNCVERRPTDDATLCLSSTRNDARCVNDEMMANLYDEGTTFHGKIKGEFDRHDLPTDSELAVKIGARMMIMVNKRKRDGRFEYVNGTIGTVIDYGIAYSRPFVVLCLDSGREVTVEPHEWENFRYELAQDGFGEVSLERVAVGSFEQIPLLPAWAITVHRCQGLTITTPIHLILQDRGNAMPGLLYVALTRCCHIEQISMNRPVSGFDCIINPEVWDFHQDNYIE